MHNSKQQTHPVGQDTPAVQMWDISRNQSATLKLEFEGVSTENSEFIYFTLNCNTNSYITMVTRNKRENKKSEETHQRSLPCAPFKALLSLHFHIVLHAVITSWKWLSFFSLKYKILKLLTRSKPHINKEFIESTLIL